MSTATLSWQPPVPNGAVISQYSVVWWLNSVAQPDVTVPGSQLSVVYNGTLSPGDELYAVVTVEDTVNSQVSAPVTSNTVTVPPAPPPPPPNPVQGLSLVLS